MDLSKNPGGETPDISVIVLNYNGARWLDRCLASLRHQALGPRMEVIVADNLSTDGSDLQAQRLIEEWDTARFIQHGANLGYCEGNNRAAQAARGRFLFFLNNDTWLEPDCLEVLLREVLRHQATAATPLILNYDDNSFQSLGAMGFDVCGLTSTRARFSQTRDVWMPEGCSYLIDRELFEKLGGFDPQIFMYSDEVDLSWRVWLAGGRAIGVPASRLHHRGAANVNPKGSGTVVELRTSDSKRYYSNRNGLVVVAKNAQSLLLLMLPLQVMLLLAEAAVGLLLVRRWSFVRRTCLEAIRDAWRLRGHIRDARRKNRLLRRRGDWWMLRFLRLRLNRWDDLLRVRQYGVPKVNAS